MQLNLKISLTLFFLLSAVTVFSQSEGKDVVILNNGDTLQGTIIEQRPGRHIKLLQLPSQDTLKIEYGRIEALQYLTTSDPVIPNDTDTLLVQDTLTTASSEDIPAPSFNQRKTYIGIGAAGGGGVWSNIGIGGSFLYTVTPKLQAGISLYFFQGTGQETVISQALPVCADVLYIVGTSKRQRLSSLIGTSLGYSVNLNEPPSNGATLLLKNGFYLNPFIGGRINFSPNSGIRLDVGYQFVSGSTYIKSTGDLYQNNQQHNLLFKATIFF